MKMALLPPLVKLLVDIIAYGALLVLFFEFLFLFLYRFVMSRISKRLAHKVGSWFMAFGYKGMSGDGLAAFQDETGQWHLLPFDHDVEEGAFWIDGVGFLPHDEVKMGSLYGIPFICAYEGYAGLMNGAAAKIGEYVKGSQKSGAIAPDNAASADGGTVRAGAAEALDPEEVPDEVDLPERAVVDPRGARWLDMYNSVPDRVARIKDLAEARAKGKSGISPLKLAVGAVALYFAGIFTVWVFLMTLGGGGGGGGGSTSVLGG